jgi:DNA primase
LQLRHLWVLENGKKAITSISGIKTLVIIPDNDEAGLNHAKDIIKNLQDIVHTRSRLIELDGLNPKEDVSDWLNNHTVEELKIIVGKY